MFLRDATRRVLAAALMTLLAVTFVTGVLASSPALTNQLLLGGNKLLLSTLGASSSDAEDNTNRGDTLAAPEATVQETTADRTDEAEDPRPEEAIFDTAFVHRATRDNIVRNSTYLDDPLANGDPDVILYVTQNWNPGGGPGTYNNHPIGVWYDARVERWAIFNQDLAAMPEGAAFSVVVLKES